MGSYEITKKYRSSPENRIKRNARRRIEYLLSVGKIKRKPCEKCGDIPVHAHHEDYSKRDEVVWLCYQHHMEAHGGSFKKKK